MRFAPTSLPLILSLSGSLVALGACGDDEGGTGSTPGSTSSSEPTSSSGPNTTNESVDTTAGPGEGTTTDDPTTGMESSSGTPMTESETSSDGPLAFRFNSIELTDPGAGIGGPCNNADIVNGLLAPALSNDDDGDGFLDMAFVVDFPALDQADGASGMLNFANAQCTAPDGDMCGLLPDSELYPLMYTVMGDGTCLEPDPVNVEPGTGDAGSTTGPCFVTEQGDAVVVTSAVAIPMSDARLAARFVGEPAGNLVEGTIQGYLSRTDAENTVVTTPLGDQQLDQLLCQEQADGDGWWIHMNFTALPTEWQG